MNFRYDINGLRAIAVIAVVFFHFNPQWLPGGFAGVDVFFVISGFLMTAIIFNGIEKNTFNLFKFYNARANRIIPVLAMMSACLLIFGWFYLIPTDYRDLGRQIEKGSLFISNLLFAKGGGYFDTAEHTKWLLHTWSLSVEWQFYIFFPIIIFILKKYLSFTNLKRVVVALFFASFIYCIYLTYKDSKTAYFLLSTRAWEMLLGGIAFLYPWSLKNKQHQITTQNFGLILILLSYFFISKDTPWPGYMALIPTLGSYLIIVSNYQNNILISNSVFSYIGKWSYSIYIWHWPIVVFGFYLALTDWWIYGIPLSILLGFLSYQFIEKINFTRYSSWKKIYKVKPFYIFLVIFICGYIIKETDGAKFHYSDKVTAILNEVKNSNPYKCLSSKDNDDKLPLCKIGNQNNIKAIIVGDSHADSIITSITSLLDLNNEGIIALVKSGCAYKFENRHNTPDCNAVNKKREEYLEKYAGFPIIISNRYTTKFEGENDPERNKSSSKDLESEIKRNDYLLFKKDLHTNICKLTKKSNVYIVLQIPELGFNAPKTMARHLLYSNFEEKNLSFNEYKYRSNRTNNILREVSNSCGATTLDPSEILCRSGKCLYETNGIPIYRDGDHLSEYGNKLLTPMFKEALN